MSQSGHRFCVLEGNYAVCRLAPRATVPAWAAGEWVNITRTSDELSIMCRAEGVPADVQAERDWRVLKLAGPFPFATVGVLAAMAAPLAQAGISLLAVATYDTDYLLVRSAALAEALRALAAAGHVNVA